MNRIVKALLAHPELVDDAAPGGSVGFEFLLHRLGDEVLSESEWDAIPREPGPGASPLRSGYLPILTGTEWARALDAARPDGAGGTDWRTVMVSGASGRFGATAPQDSSDEPVVALFAGPVGAAGLVVYRPLRNAYGETGPDRHCGPPSRGVCGPGACGGCRARRVWDAATGPGIACRCPDGTPG